MRMKHDKWQKFCVLNFLFNFSINLFVLIFSSKNNKFSIFFHSFFAYD